MEKKGDLELILRNFPTAFTLYKKVSVFFLIPVLFWTLMRDFLIFSTAKRRIRSFSKRCTAKRTISFRKVFAV